ncbi:MAG TPA: elongation factor G [Egibacteraceae bacterium]|nr:elongation factor G [Egibacteraceae bacterium]
MAGNDPTPTARIRNVVLLGHGGAGKTALAEALLSIGGAGDGRGGTFDHEPEEKERGHSLGLAMGSLRWQGHKINLLDAPGMPDSIGDAYPALRAADVAIFVVDATAGVQAQHEQLWAACDDLGLPRLVFLNKLERDGAAFQPHVDALRERYGKAVAPAHMPIGVRAEFTGVIDLLHFTAVELIDGKRVEEDVPESRREQAERNRELLVEAIVENDDQLLERYLEGEVPDPKELGEVFAHGIAECGFYPLLCGSAQMGIGVQLLADFLIEECPSPAAGESADGAERALDGPVALYVAKTLSDPYVGRINILRVLSGRLQQDANVVVHRSGSQVRLHQLFTLQGKEQTPLTAAEAGDICGVAKLDDVLTGDVLHVKEAPFHFEPIPLPEPYHRVALEPQAAGDEDKLSTALARLVEEDPSLLVERDPETHQLVLRAYGPTHVDVTLARLERKFGVHVQQMPLRMTYRETLRGPGTGLGRHVKQSGGHGQYGIAHIEVEPLLRGDGFEFENKIVGGVIPHQWIPSVEKGVREAMAHGVLAGYPVVDVRVRLVDGKHHSVDSSDMAFQVAGSLAFRDAAEKAGVALLEPVMEVAVIVPDDLTGDVMGDLSSRRGRIQGTEQSSPGRTTISALVPEAELLTYVAELRSLSSGAGAVTMTYHHHEELPDNIAKKVVAAAAEER